MDDMPTWLRLPCMSADITCACLGVFCSRTCCIRSDDGINNKADGQLSEFFTVIPFTVFKPLFYIGIIDRHINCIRMVQSCKEAAT